MLMEANMYPHLGIVGEQALRVAASNGHLAVVQYLCELPPSCGLRAWSSTHNNPDPNREPVILAVVAGHTPVVRYLCRRWSEAAGLCCNSRGSRVMTPPLFHTLTWAAALGRLSLIRDLCTGPTAHGFGVNPDALHGHALQHALQRAAQYDQLPVVRFLCELPPRYGLASALLDALGQAAAHGHLEVVQFLCARLAAPSCGQGRHTLVHLQNIALVWAASKGRMRVVRHLCELPPARGVEPSFLNNAAVRHAATGGHLSVVRFLCELPVARGVDPAACDNFAVKCAAQLGYLSLVHYLCELPPHRGIRVTYDGGLRRGLTSINDALVGAAFHGYLAVVRYLCALPPARGFAATKWLPLALAVATQRGHEAVAQHLRGLMASSGLVEGDIWETNGVREGSNVVFAARQSRAFAVVICDMTKEQSYDDFRDSDSGSSGA